MLGCTQIMLYLYQYRHPAQSPHPYSCYCETIPGKLNQGGGAPYCCSCIFMTSFSYHKLNYWKGQLICLFIIDGLIESGNHVLRKSICSRGEIEIKSDECMQWAVVCIHIKRGGGMGTVRGIERNAAPRIKRVGFHGYFIDWFVYAHPEPIRLFEVGLAVLGSRNNCVVLFLWNPHSVGEECP